MKKMKKIKMIIIKEMMILINYLLNFKVFINLSMPILLKKKQISLYIYAKCRNSIIKYNEYHKQFSFINYNFIKK